MRHRRSRLHRQQGGSLVVEAAYALPVVVAAAMMFLELANIGLTINFGASAMERAVQQFRRDGVAALQAADMGSRLAERMAAASHGYLAAENIASVDVEPYASLNAMGGGVDDKDSGSTDVPAWRISVDIRKDFITPLPRLLGIDSGNFRYRYQQVLAYLPQEKGE